MPAADQTETPAAAVEVLSFQAVYTDHAAFVWRVLRRLGVRPADLEDVCQEVFVVVHRKLSGFANRSSLRTWLYGIAVRCASDHRRRAHVQRETPSDLLDDRSADATQPADVAQRQARALLDAMIDALDDDKRTVFVLFELEELPMAEVAEIVGCALQTAYSRLHAAREQIDAAVKRLRAKESAS